MKYIHIKIIFQLSLKNVRLSLLQSISLIKESFDFFLLTFSLNLSFSFIIKFLRDYSFSFKRKYIKYSK